MIASSGQPPPFLKQLSNTSSVGGGDALLPSGRVQLDPLHGKYHQFHQHHLEAAGSHGAVNMIGGGDVQIPVLKQGSLFKTRLVYYYLFLKFN